MIFLPNKFEKFTAGLRNIFQKLILKNGIKEVYLKNLCKIYEAEAILTVQPLLPINLKAYAYELLTAIFLKKLTENKSFDFFVNISGNYLFKKKIFTALILNVCRQAEYIEIFEIKKNTVVRADFKNTERIEILVKKLNGQILFEKITERCLLVIPLDSTEKKSEDFEAAYTLLQNPLSPVNFYL